jgi:hypothetical protein
MYPAGMAALEIKTVNVPAKNIAAKNLEGL